MNGGALSVRSGPTMIEPGLDAGRIPAAASMPGPGRDGGRVRADHMIQDATVRLGLAAAGSVLLQQAS